MGAMFVVRLKALALIGAAARPRSLALTGATLTKASAHRVAAGIGVLVLLAGCTLPKQAATHDAATEPDSTAPTKPKPSPSTTPPPPDPDTETCRELRFGDVGRYANDTPTTSCDKRHTGFTFEVTELPPDIAFDGVQIKNDAIQQAAGRSCRQAFEDYVGGDAATRARVRLTVTYFLPSQAEYDAGARWVRCDIIALQGERILAELPATLEGFLDDDDAINDYGLCSTGQPGAADSKMVACEQPHSYRAVVALRLGAMDDSYPGETTTSIQGKQRCEDLIVKLLDTDSSFTYSWTFPTPQDWRAGQRFGYCWNKTAT